MRQESGESWILSNFPSCMQDEDFIKSVLVVDCPLLWETLRAYFKMITFPLSCQEQGFSWLFIVRAMGFLELIASKMWESPQTTVPGVSSFQTVFIRPQQFLRVIFKLFCQLMLVVYCFYQTDLSCSSLHVPFAQFPGSNFFHLSSQLSSTKIVHF